MRVSIIVSTYNRPDALRLSIQSLFNQTILPSEIVICDDGSTKETTTVINVLKQKSPIPLIHVWHEDTGFRLAAIRNKGIIVASGEYIIQIDGDIIAHKNFVEDHIRISQPNCLLKGGRVFINQKQTNKLIDSLRLKNLGFLSRGLGRRTNSLRNKKISEYLASRYKKNSLVVIGCNMSFWKQDVLDINGYDEFFEGWGAEDADLAIRLMNKGVKMLHLKFCAIAFHLWHNEHDRSKSISNTEYYKKQVSSKSSYCARGIDQYTKDEINKFII